MTRAKNGESIKKYIRTKGGKQIKICEYEVVNSDENLTPTFDPRRSTSATVPKPNSKKVKKSFFNKNDVLGSESVDIKTGNRMEAQKSD